MEQKQAAIWETLSQPLKDKLLANPDANLTREDFNELAGHIVLTSTYWQGQDPQPLKISGTFQRFIKDQQ